MATANTEKESEFLDDFAKPPFLRRVQIQGYKSIEFCDVTFEPLTVLVGRNASGKSNFLDALGFLADVMKMGLEHAITQRNGWRAIHNRNGCLSKISFEIEAGVPSFVDDRIFQVTYSFSFKEDERNQIEVLREDYEIRKGNIVSGITRRGNTIGFKDYSAPSTLEVVSTQLALHSMVTITRTDISDWMARIGISNIYGFLPSEIRKHQPIAGTPLLSADGRNLARAITSLDVFEHETVERIIAFLQSIVPEIRTLRRVEYGDFETVRFELNNSLEFDASSMSDGTLRILAALVAAFQFIVPSVYPGFIGIEEPETSLHPAAMHALVDALIEATGRTQIILSTHSTELLDNPNIKPENIRVVEMQDGKTVIAPVDEASLEIIHSDLDTLGGLERQNQLEPNADDVQRQQEAAAKLRENGK